MPMFRVPVWWMTSGVVKVEAESLDQALVKAADEGSPVMVMDECYVDDSWTVDAEAAKDLAEDDQPNVEKSLD